MAARVRRAGLIGLKLGMTQTWTRNGQRLALTALQVLDNEVVATRTPERDGRASVQVGAINHSKPAKLHNAQRVMYARLGISPKRHLREFTVSAEALLPPGTPLTAAHFLPGQYVDVVGTTIGKGFQGVMKRHNMKGQSRSHGQTKTHRKMGGSGGGTDPGRVWPGKRMAGHMGDIKTITRNLESLLDIRDAWRKHNKFVYPPPCPTAAPDLLAPGIYEIGDELPIEPAADKTAAG